MNLVLGSNSILKRQILRGSILLGVALITAALVLGYLIWEPSKHTGNVLRALGQTRLGVTTTQELRDLLATQGLKDQHWHCQGSQCVYAFAAENRWLQRLHLAPLAYFMTNAKFENDRLTEVLVTAEVATGGQNPFVRVDSKVQPPVSCPEHICVRKAGSAHGSSTETSITMDSSVSPQLFRRALGLDTSCLTRLGWGCKNAAELLPAF